MNDTRRRTLGDGMTEAAGAVACVLLAVAWPFGLAAVGVASLASAVLLAIVLRGRSDVNGGVVGDSTPGSGIALLTVAVLAGGLFVAWYVGDASLVAVWVPAVVGAAVAAGAWALAGRSGLVRHRLLAMAAVLWGFTVTVTWGAAGLDALPILFWGLGALLGGMAGWVAFRSRS